MLTSLRTGQEQTMTHVSLGLPLNVGMAVTPNMIREDMVLVEAVEREGTPTLFPPN